MAADLLAILLKANLAASAAIVLVFILRKPVRRRFGARIAYAFWLTVPVAIGASLLPARTVVVSSEWSAPAAVEVLAAPAGQGVTTAGDVSASAVLAVIWFVGAALSMAILLWSQARYMRRLGRVRREGDRILRAASLGAAPAVVGIFNPKIVLPADFETRYRPEEQRVVLAHEAAHLESGDTLVNGLIALLRCLFWFNPLIYFADRLMRIDQELACDAAVLAAHPTERRLYGEALLKTQIASASLPLGCYWPSRASARLKERIQMLTFDRPSRARRLGGATSILVACVSLGVSAWAAQPAAYKIAAAPASSESPASSAAQNATSDEGPYHRIETYPVQLAPYALTVIMPDGKVGTLTSARPAPPLLPGEATVAYRRAQRTLAAARREAAARAARGAPPQPLTPELEAAFDVFRSVERTVRERRATAPETRYDRISVTYPAGSRLGGETLTRPRTFGVSVRTPFTAETKARTLASIDREIAGASAYRREELGQLRAIVAERPTVDGPQEAARPPARAPLTITIIPPPPPPPTR